MRPRDVDLCALRDILIAVLVGLLVFGGCAHPAEIRPGDALTTDGEAWSWGKSGDTEPDPFGGARNIDLRTIHAPTFEPMEPVK